MKTKIKFLSVQEFDDKLNFAIKMDGELYRTDLYRIWVPKTRGVLSDDTPFEEVEIEAEIKKYEPEYNGNIFFFPKKTTNLLSLIVGDLNELKKVAKAKITQNIETVIKDAFAYRKAMLDAKAENEWFEIKQNIKRLLFEGISPFLLEREKGTLFWECIDEYCVKKYGVRCYKTLSSNHLMRNKNEKYIDFCFPYEIVNLEDEIANKAECKRILDLYEMGKFHISQDPRGGENGKDGYYKFDVIDKTDGKTYVFVWRDVFDFGTWGFPFRDGIDPFKEETWSEKEREIYKFVRAQFPGGTRM